MPQPTGYSFERRGEEIWIFAHGRRVTTLRGAVGARFALEVERLPETGRQHAMARLTGNYKRGNERRLTT